MTAAASSDIKDRLPARTSGQAPATTQQPASPATLVRQAIERQSEGFKAVMPRGVDADRFSRLVLTAVKATPQLMECFGTTQGQTTVLLSAMQAAAVGLEPNTATQDCWLLPRRNQGVMECQLSIGYRGLLKLARRSGVIKTIYAEVVHEKDHFVWSRGLEEDHLEHIAYDGQEHPGELTHAYAVARYVNGGYSFIVLSRRQVEARRAMSDSWKNERARQYSPWTKWPEEMWRKTAVRALVPYLELSTEAAQVVASDETRLVFREEDGVIDVDAEQHELGAGPPPEEVNVEQPQPAGGDQPPGASTAEDEAPGDDPSGGAPSDEEFRPMAEPQSRALHALLKAKYGPTATGDGRFPILMALLDREITSTKQISYLEAGWLIDKMQALPDHEAPEPDAA